MKSFHDTFTYNPDTGEITRIETGKVTGTRMKIGYLKTGHNYKEYYCHRLAWYLMTGDWPENQIDHINGVRDDNRWCNLREATGQENMWNTPGHNNLSGYKNVHFHRRSGKWHVYFRVNGSNKSFGYYDDVELAGLVAEEARNKYRNEYANHEHYRKRS